MIYSQSSLKNAFTANIARKNLSREIITLEDVFESVEDEDFKTRFNEEAPSLEEQSNKLNK